MKNINLTSKGVSVEIKDVFKSPEDLSRLIECLSEYKELLVDHIRRHRDDQEFWESV